MDGTTMPNRPPRKKPGSGQVQRGIKRAFLTQPRHAFTTRELLAWTHPRAVRETLAVRRNRCRAIRRAADQVAIRVGRRWPDLAAEIRVIGSKSGSKPDDIAMISTPKNGDDMAHKIPHCIEWITSIHTLHPGDILATGTNHR